VAGPISRFSLYGRTIRPVFEKQLFGKCHGRPAHPAIQARTCVLASPPLRGGQKGPPRSFPGEGPVESKDLYRPGRRGPRKKTVPWPMGRPKLYREPDFPSLRDWDRTRVGGRGGWARRPAPAGPAGIPRRNPPSLEEMDDPPREATANYWGVFRKTGASLLFRWSNPGLLRNPIDRFPGKRGDADKGDLKPAPSRRSNPRCLRGGRYMEPESGTGPPDPRPEDGQPTWQDKIPRMALGNNLWSDKAAGFRRNYGRALGGRPTGWMLSALRRFPKRFFETRPNGTGAPNGPGA